MAIATDRDKVRLTIGDTDVTAQLFQDDEIDYFLDLEGDNILKASAAACEAAATKFARAYDFETDNQRFARSSMWKAFKDLGSSLRARAAGLVIGPDGSALIGTVKTVDSTRVDGWSDDIANQETMSSGITPRRRFYGPQDEAP